MAERVDMSTRVTLHASALLQRTKARVKAMVPYGPMQVKLTPSEALSRLNALSPHERTELAQSVGVDELLRTVADLRTKVGEQ